MTHIWAPIAWLVLPELAPDWDGTQTTEADLDDTDGLSHFPIKSGSLSLDRSRVPFAQADQVVVAIESAQVSGAYWSVIPDGISVAWLYMGPAEGPFQQVNLLVRQASADYARKELTLTLEGAEAVLQDYAALTVDMSQQADQGSLNTIVGNVLAAAGCDLDGSLPTDVDMTLRSTVTNLFTDPMPRATPLTASPSSAWTQQALNCSVDGADATWAPYGDRSWNLFSSTSTDSYLELNANGPLSGSGLQAGKTYTVSASGNVKVALTNTSGVRSRRIVVIPMINGVAQPDIYSPQVPNTVGAATRVSVQFTVLPTWTGLVIRVYLGENGGAGGQIRWAGFRVSEDQGFDDGLPFDGASTGTGYTYSWQGTANASSSTRTADADNHLSLTWQAGVSAWDFVQGLVNTAKRRLFADETGLFHLVDPDAYSLPGSVILNEMNSTALTDSVDATAGLGNATGVVVKYKPLPDGTPVTDSDGTPEKVLVVDFTDRDYPGPGAAANILARRSTNGRVQVGSTVPDWTARPSMEVRINYTNPGFPDGDFAEVGLIQSVEWDLATGLMTITPSSLLDASPGSWLAATDTWATAGAGSWASDTTP